MQAPKFPVWFKGKAGVLEDSGLGFCPALLVFWATGFLPSPGSAVPLENVREPLDLRPLGGGLLCCVCAVLQVAALSPDA